MTNNFVSIGIKTLFHSPSFSLLFPFCLLDTTWTTSWRGSKKKYQDGGCARSGCLDKLLALPSLPLRLSPCVTRVEWPIISREVWQPKGRTSFSFRENEPSGEWGGRENQPQKAQFGKMQLFYLLAANRGEQEEEIPEGEDKIEQENIVI